MENNILLSGRRGGFQVRTQARDSEDGDPGEGGSPCTFQGSPSSPGLHPPPGSVAQSSAARGLCALAGSSG